MTLALGLASVGFFNWTYDRWTEISVDLPQTRSEGPLWVIAIYRAEIPSVGSSGCGKIPELNESDAVVLAEQFIADNGYTDLAPKTGDIFYEFMDEGSDGEILRSRQGTLEPKAYGIVRDRKGGAPGWTVVFRNKRSGSSKHGRAVTMSPFGSDTRVEHVDVFLKGLKRS